MKYSMEKVLSLVALFLMCSQDFAAVIVYPFGDVANCFPGEDIKRFEVLPGGGWDNLRNIPGGQVASSNYSLCRLTEDKSYLIPDNTYVIPVKQSRVDSFAEIIKHWSDYKSTTATSVNVGASFSGFGVSVSGSFSHENHQVKDQQVKDSSSTVRVTLKHHVYTMALQPGFELHPDFKSRLLDAARHIEGNNTRMVDYELDLLVRDYGTHVITSAEAGASLAQLQQIRSNYLQNHEKAGTSTEVKASASAHFFVSVGFHMDVKHSSSSEQTKGYSDNLTHSQIMTFGGPAFRSNFTVNDWEKGVPNALVAIDRAGSPLNFVINRNNMQELSEVTLFRLTHDIERAIGRYYKFNTVLGCTNHSKSNFDFQANVDDGSCEKTIGEFIFGGVFQNTSIEPVDMPMFLRNSDRLRQLDQHHPVTKNYSCPVGFKEAVLKKGHMYSSRRYCDCDRYDRCSCRYILLATYTSYWCYKHSSNPTSKQSTGLLYGGFYTSTSSNPVTETHDCPAKFYPLHIGRDIKVCVSDAYTEGAKFSQSFAGFFSCQAGNPLLFEPQSAAGSLESFVESQPPSTWPSRCPLGYSQHLVTIEDDCEINVCTRSKNNKALKIKRPPFQRPPQLLSMSMLQPAAEVWKGLTMTGQQWTHQGASLVPESDIKSSKYTSEELSAERNAADGLQDSQIAGISIGVTLLVATIVVILVLSFKRRQTCFGHPDGPAGVGNGEIVGSRQSCATLFDHVPHPVVGTEREQRV